MNYLPLHKFHIPVMGLAFTIDSPIKVARFGISSVISIVEDRLIEMMRSHYYAQSGLVYQPIHPSGEDYRARRITDYLNLVNNIVQSQIEKIKIAAFEKGSEIVKYFEMLPEDSKLKSIYHQMLETADQIEKKRIEIFLRKQVRAGSIDVNIMTKVDRDVKGKDGDLLPEGSDAVAALRGYAKSDLSNSSVIFSAGMNPRLYNYLASCDEFDLNENGEFKKKVVVKVSDYRSALVQGKYLAKRGIWVSEFRIESGLNCGGHAFATDGFLLGPILEEFKIKRQDLVTELFEIYREASDKIKSKNLINPPQLVVSFQGGLGTHEEDIFLQKNYELVGTGWGTPFLLVPESTTVDDNTLRLLCNAKKEDVALSHNSPLGVRFHYLKGTTSDKEKMDRIRKGKPGSPCTEKHLVSNTEFTEEPICTASYKYQKLKIAQIESLDLPVAEHGKQIKNVLDKECLCIGLSNSAAINYEKTFVKKLDAVTICPGPNIVNFSKVVSLQTMIDHIYGRTNLVTNPSRPHVFIAELNLYINFLKEQLEAEKREEMVPRRIKYFQTFYTNLKAGINYYRDLYGQTLYDERCFIDYLKIEEDRLENMGTLYQIGVSVN
ncbi:MAG: hypothetical protein ABIP35_02850 [Ginsengibacter sp.]